MINCCKILPLLLFSFLSAKAFPSIISAEEYSLFLSSDGLTESGFDRHLFDPDSNLSDLGFTVSTFDELNSQFLGGFTWRVANTGQSDLTSLGVTVYLDAAVDQLENTYFNERASYVGDTQATSWEVDEPGWSFGDIYGNAINGELDNMSSLTPGFEDDSALALGFYLDNFNVGDTFDVTFATNTHDIGGLYQYDPDSDFGFFFNAYLSYSPATTDAVPVSESGEQSTLSIGLAGLSILFWRRIRSTNSKVAV